MEEKISTGTLGHKKRGKLLTSHRYNLLSLLPSDPGEIQGSWSYETYPSTKLYIYYNSQGCDTFFVQKIHKHTKPKVGNVCKYA